MAEVWANGVPETPTMLAEELRSLREARRARKKTLQPSRPRPSLTKAERELVLSKTDGRCHVCGGVVGSNWQADHVLAHSGGGQANVENYLPAHGLCNNYRWDYLPEEFQLILKIGVWARTNVEKDTRLGREIAAAFLRYDQSRFKRRRQQNESRGELRGRSEAVIE